MREDLFAASLFCLRVEHRPVVFVVVADLQGVSANHDFGGTHHTVEGVFVVLKHPVIADLVVILLGTVARHDE